MTLDRREFAATLLGAFVAPRFLRSSTPRTAAPAINVPSDAFLATLPGMMEIAGVPGIGMAVVRNGQPAWTKYLGVMDATTNQPATADTLWAAASLSKPVFTYAALHLVDEGKLDLDRPLRSYVPDHAPDDPRGNKITARHVLSHSSGLRNWRNRIDQPLVPDFEPGTRFQYSGEGFYYLQRSVEHITGLGFEQFMQERLFTPLGMKNSTYFWRSDVGARLVTGHDRGQVQVNFSKDFAPRLLAAAEARGLARASYTHEELVAIMQTMTPAPAAIPNAMIPNSAGSLITTPTDYAAFLIELLEGRNGAITLKPATRALMSTQQSRINSALGWGLGIGQEQQGDAHYLWHWGDNGGWKNFVLVHPDSHSAIVVFTNGSKGLNVAQQIITAATGELHAAFLWL